MNNNGGFMSLFDHFSDFIESPGNRKWQPPVDIYESEDYFFIVSELAGVNKNDIKIIIRDGILRFSGEKVQCFDPRCTSAKKFHRIERPAGFFEREIRIPSYVSFEDMSVRFDNGILEIVFRINQKTVINIKNIE